MASSLPNIKVALKGTTEPVDIQVTDADGQQIDADILKLSILDANGSSVLWQDDFITPPPGGTNIQKPAGTTGYYYYPFGIVTSAPGVQGQTENIGDYIAQWTVRAPGSPIATMMQNIKVVDAMTMYNVPYLRLIIDKSRKVVDTANDVFLGYTDAQLVMFMEGGMQIINGYQPEGAYFNLSNFPWRDFRHLANEAALMAGVLSQQIFAIDTDLPNYTDQGTTFVIAHQPQLAALLNQVAQRLDKAIPAMKFQFVSTGSIHLEQGPNFRLAQLMQAAPSGALFRNIFFKG